MTRQKLKASKGIASGSADLAYSRRCGRCNPIGTKPRNALNRRPLGIGASEQLQIMRNNRRARYLVIQGAKSRDIRTCRQNGEASELAARRQTSVLMKLLS